MLKRFFYILNLTAIQQNLAHQAAMFTMSGLVNKIKGLKKAVKAFLV
ncbi:hypothetical protein PTUN_a2167 [Pseudoalteromonas tunicata]|uniref:Uncharacterized protein n=1 Tax=Pseudoalteromonas tunicata D2 TaxID=87626 RepID=A4C9T7_9GAMM|nr:hypothetical protein PTUN_a2167 [Pseudoalteromonas tunicata]EAR28145.1 hypothetical protein PTD2_20057 [Pseudoalteromonas tunicata D2]